MPFVHFPLRLKPVGQVCTVIVTTLMPQLMSALCNLFFQADALVHA